MTFGELAACSRLVDDIPASPGGGGAAAAEVDAPAGAATARDAASDLMDAVGTDEEASGAGPTDVQMEGVNPADSEADSDAEAIADTYSEGAPDTGNPADTGNSVDADNSADTGSPADAGNAVDSYSAPDTSDMDVASPADGSATAFSPANLPGLALWLDSTRGLDFLDAGAQPPGLSWLDMSGNHNDAVSIGGSLGTPLIVPNAIGGKPAVHFNGTSGALVVSDKPSLQFGFDDFAIVEVAAHTTPTSGTHPYGILYDKQDSTYAGPVIVANWNNEGLIRAQIVYPDAFIRTPVTNYDNGVPFFLVFRRIANDGGATLDLRVTGVDVASSISPSYTIDVSAVGTSVLIGGSRTQQSILGDIAEVIVVKGGLSSRQVADLEDYLRTKYGF
jgi:hypothetical protein